jgi:hypothetical protein
MKPPLHVKATQRRLARYFTRAAIQHILKDPKLKMDWKTISAVKAKLMRNRWHHRYAELDASAAKAFLLVKSSAEAQLEKYGHSSRHPKTEEAHQALTWTGEVQTLVMFPQGACL